MAIVFVVGVILALAAPLLRRYGRAGSLALAGGAATLIAIAIGGLVHPNLRAGEAAVEENFRFSLLVLACEVPVLALAVVSQGRFKKAFWVGWGIHLALTAWVTAVVIWLEFFWHW